MLRCPRKRVKLFYEKEFYFKKQIYSESITKRNSLMPIPKLYEEYESNSLVIIIRLLM